MAQPTRCDSHAGCPRLRQDNRRRKQWRRKPRAGRKRPRRSGKSSTGNLKGVLVEHPIFLRSSPTVSKLLLSSSQSSRESPRRETADARADVPGGRVRRVIGRVGSQSNHRKGGLSDGEEG